MCVVFFMVIKLVECVVVVVDCGIMVEEVVKVVLGLERVWVMVGSGVVWSCVMLVIGLGGCGLEGGVTWVGTYAG